MWGSMHVSRGICRGDQVGMHPAPTSHQHQVCPNLCQRVLLTYTILLFLSIRYTGPSRTRLPGCASVVNGIFWMWGIFHIVLSIPEVMTQKFSCVISISSHQCRARLKNLLSSNLQTLNCKLYLCLKFIRPSQKLMSPGLWSTYEHMVLIGLSSYTQS